MLHTFHVIVTVTSDLISRIIVSNRLMHLYENNLEMFIFPKLF